MFSFFNGIEAIAMMLLEMLLTKTAMPNFDNCSGSPSPVEGKPTETSDDTAGSCLASFFER